MVGGLRLLSESWRIKREVLEAVLEGTVPDSQFPDSSHCSVLWHHLQLNKGHVRRRWSVISLIIGYDASETRNHITVPRVLGFIPCNIICRFHIRCSLSGKIGRPIMSTCSELKPRSTGSNLGNSQRLNHAICIALRIEYTSAASTASTTTAGTSNLAEFVLPC